MSDDPLDLVRRRLDAVTVSGEPESVLDPDALVEAYQALSGLDDGSDRGHLRKWEIVEVVANLHWQRLQFLGSGEGDEDLHQAAALFAQLYPAYPEAVPERCGSSSRPT